MAAEIRHDHVAITIYIITITFDFAERKSLQFLSLAHWVVATDVLSITAVIAETL